MPKNSSRGNKDPRSPVGSNIPTCDSKQPVCISHKQQSRRKSSVLNPIESNESNESIEPIPNISQNVEPTDVPNTEQVSISESGSESGICGDSWEDCEVEPNEVVATTIRVSELKITPTSPSTPSTKELRDWTYMIKMLVQYSKSPGSIDDAISSCDQRCRRVLKVMDVVTDGSRVGSRGEMFEHDDNSIKRLVEDDAKALNEFRDLCVVKALITGQVHRCLNVGDLLNTGYFKKGLLGEIKKSGKFKEPWSCGYTSGGHTCNKLVLIG